MKYPVILLIFLCGISCQKTSVAYVEHYVAKAGTSLNSNGPYCNWVHNEDSIVNVVYNTPPPHWSLTGTIYITGRKGDSTTYLMYLSKIN